MESFLNEYIRNNVYFDCAKKFKNEVLNFFNKTWDDIRLTMKSRINDNFQILTKSRV
jgi:hypothetical protein